MYDLVVIGGGTGGIGVAHAAADAGARVAIIEKGELGGAHAHSAGVPLKALVRAARAAAYARKAAGFGVKVGNVEVDFPAVMARIQQTIRRASERCSAAALAERGIDVIQGAAAFDAYDTVLVDGKTRVEGKRFVVATGSRAAVPAVPGLSGSGYLDSTSVWSLTKLPESLIVFGARPEAIEFAQAFRRLGSRVTLLTDQPDLLANESPEVSERLWQALVSEGVEIKPGVTLQKVENRDNKRVVTYQDAAGTVASVAASQLLLASGRCANLKGLNLEALGIHGDDESGIEVDDYLQTRAPSIYAIGDVIARDRSAHAAEREAETVFQNAVLRLPRKLDLRALPRVIGCDPEVAAVGLTQAEALLEDPDAQTFRADLTDNDRALIDDASNGFAQATVDSSGAILGAVVVGPDAALVLQPVVLAMEKGLSLAALAETSTPAPSYAGLVHALASRFQQERKKSSIVHSALRWYHGFGGRDQTESAAPAAAAASEAHGH